MFIPGVRTAVMVTVRSHAPAHARPPTHGMAGNPGTATKGGTPAGSPDLADIPATPTIAIGARRAETRT